MTQELAGIFMSLADLVERAYDVWDDGTRCAARSHPGVAHKRRASDSVVTMLDTYDALQWESKDCDDDDAEVIGAFSSDEEADGEDSEKGAADDADDQLAGEVSLSAESVDLLKSHGKCKSIRKGWKIVPKDEAAELTSRGRQEETAAVEARAPLGPIWLARRHRSQEVPLHPLAQVPFPMPVPRCLSYRGCRCARAEH